MQIQSTPEWLSVSATTGEPLHTNTPYEGEGSEDPPWAAARVRERDNRGAAPARVQGRLLDVLATPWHARWGCMMLARMMVWQQRRSKRAAIFVCTSEAQGGHTILPGS